MENGVEQGALPLTTQGRTAVFLVNRLMMFACNIRFVASQFPATRLYPGLKAYCSSNRDVLCMSSTIILLLHTLSSFGLLILQSSDWLASFHLELLQAILFIAV